MKVDSGKLAKLLRHTLPYGIIGVLVGYLSTEIAFVPWHPALVGLAAAVVLRGLVYLRGRNAKKYRKDREYGSARWGTAKDIKPYVDPKPENNIILTATESLTMNSRPKPVKYARNKNVIVIGGSGSGKTRFFVTPNLMQCQSKDYPVSFVCTDPKGQLCSDTSTTYRHF